MFDELTKRYAPEDMIVPAKKRVKANKAALRSLIRQEEEMMNKKTRAVKKLIAAAVCAAAALSCGVAAYAANSDIFSMVFGGDGYEELSGLTGKPEVLSIETYVDGLTVIPEGYASDGFDTYFVFRMDFDKKLPEDAMLYYENLSDKKWEDVYSAKGVLSLAPGITLKEYDAIEDFWWRFDQIGEKSMYAIFQIHFKEQFSGRYEFVLKPNSLWYFLNEPDAQHDREAFIDDKLFSADVRVDIQPYEAIQFDTSGTRFEDYTFTATPCSFRVHFQKEGVTDARKPYESLYYSQFKRYLLMKDGSRLVLRYLGNPYNTLSSDGVLDVNLRHSFDMPIDPENIKAFVIDGIEMPIKK